MYIYIVLVIPFSFPGQLSAVGITKSQTLHSDRHRKPSPKLLQVPLQLAGKLYQDSRDYQGNFGEDQPKSSYFYIIDKVLKFLLAAGGLSVPRRAVLLPRARGQREQWWEIQFIQDSDRQHWCSSQGQECLLILRRKKESLKCAGRNGDGRAGPGEVFCRVPVSPNTELSLYLLQNYLSLLQSYYEALYKPVLLCQKREARGWAQYKKPGKGCILVFIAQRWLMNSSLHKFLKRN